MIRPAEGDSLHSPMARPCTRPAFLATSRAKIATSVSHVRTTSAPWKGRGGLRSDHSGRHIVIGFRLNEKGVHT
jgi:hypothetical protein